MKIRISPATLDGTDCIAVQIESYDPNFPATMRQIPRARWIPEQKAWIVPRSRENFDALKQLFGEHNITVVKEDAGEPLAARIEVAPPALEEQISIQPHPEKADSLFLYLPKDMTPMHLETVKNIHGRRWNPDQKMWEVPYTKITLRFLDKYFSPNLLRWTFKPSDDIPEQHPMTERPQKAPEKIVPAKYEAAVVALEQVLLLKRYSWRTIKSYKNCFRQFIRHYDEHKPSNITRAQINAYIVHLIKTKNISESHQSQILSAIKMFYAEVVDQAEKVRDLLRPKKPQKLPQVLTEGEVARLLGATDNPKHRCILMLIYSAGLRLGEVTNLRLSDMQPDQKRLFVRDAKGKKDRYTLLSEKAWKQVQTYFEVHKPANWLFEGPDGGKYSDRSVQEIFYKAKQKSRINEFATVHTLRHSFATHLLEKGVDLRYIQELLGHESSKTTEIYAQITKKGWDKIKSPLDDLDF